ncbi:hypothetical protein LB456_02210 [Psychroflexus sp. CAK57W]|nr:hypothetical protein [Psychroflexus curvus]MBZ9786260.1 hypothetical protein [Psychroflexus curvus]
MYIINKLFKLKNRQNSTIKIPTAFCNQVFLNSPISFWLETIAKSIMAINGNNSALLT